MANERITIEKLEEYHELLTEDANILKRSTAYTLDSIVNKGQIYLKCITAGTTKAQSLDLSSVDVDDTVEDGTVEWQVMSISGVPESVSSGIENWQSGTSYSNGDLVIKDYVLYQAVTTTSTTWVDSEWNPIGTNFNTTSAYTQKIVTNVVAPYEMLMQTGDSNYCKPPVNILKNVGGESGTTLTLENYNNTSAYSGTNDFLKIENGKANLYNYKEYPFTAQTLDTIDIGVSEEIDFSDFVRSGGAIDTVALLHFDDDYSDENSSNWVVSGSGINIDTVEKKIGDGSIYISNNSSLISTNNERFSFGTNDFTIEFWVKLANLSGNKGLFCKTINYEFGGIVCYGDRLYWLLSSNGTSWNISSDTDSSGRGIHTLTTDWHHIAMVRNDTNFYGFLDGELDWSKSNISDPVTHVVAPLQIGNWTASNYGFTGWIDEFAVFNIAKWTSDFTPPTQPYGRPGYNIKSLEVV